MISHNTALTRTPQMKGPLWTEAKDALLEIAEHALTHNTDGIDLRFFNNDHVSLGVQVCYFFKPLCPLLSSLGSGHD